jgi:isopenicillin-N epimerase
VVEAKIPFPITSEEEISEAILECVSPSTRIALIDHITAPTALIVPLKALVPVLQEKGIQVLVDGAHAPGNIPVDILDINPDYYTANCHKWLCAPKGAAFLYVRPDRQQQIDPLTISLAAGHDKTFEEKFYWTGTYDPTAVLCVADAIEYMGTLLPGGWPAIMKNNHRLTVQARQLVCNELGIAIPCPDAMIPSMASFFITDTENPVSFGFDHVDSLQQQLFDTHQIEIPISYWPAPPKRLIRLSAQLYNSPDEYKLLADALKKYCYS